MTGRNGGGLFVLAYLACVALVGLPIMMAEIFIGRAAQRSPVGAFRALSRPASPWMGLGWLSVVWAFVILSFYSVIAGWSLHYLWLSISQGFAGKSAEEIKPLFGNLASSGLTCTAWHVVFMVLTIGIVMAGVKGGLERCGQVLMPALFLLLLLLLVWAVTTSGFGPGLRYVIGIHDEEVRRLAGGDPGSFTAGSWLTALGQAFFSLSLGMGALVTYGSYLKRDEDLVSTSMVVSLLDTVVSLLAALVMFPILFSAGFSPNQGTGLAFTTLPMAFAQMPGGSILAPAFFLLLVFAALTSSISILEVAASYFIDERGWSRARAALITGGAALLLGVPSAWSNGPGIFNQGTKSLTGRVLGEGHARDWMTCLIDASFNLVLPIGAMGIALFVAWRVGGQAREQGFKAGSRLGRLYWGWVFLLRFVVPVAVTAVLLRAVGVI
jgi:NSS family neurotransmitter:Na+ symporter